MKWFLLALQKYAQFSGRSRRKEYWMFFLFNFLISIVAGALDEIFHLSFWASNGALNSLASLALFIPNLSVTVRRLHDTGKSGWFMLLWLVPFLLLGFGVAMMYSMNNFNTTFIYSAVIILLGIGVWMVVILATDGTPGRNKYGLNPKEGEDFGNEALDGHLL